MTKNTLSNIEHLYKCLLVCLIEWSLHVCWLDTKSPIWHYHQNIFKVVDLFYPKNHWTNSKACLYSFQHVSFWIQNVFIETRNYTILTQFHEILTCYLYLVFTCQGLTYSAVKNLNMSLLPRIHKIISIGTELIHDSELCLWGSYYTETYSANVSLPIQETCRSTSHFGILIFFLELINPFFPNIPGDIFLWYAPCIMRQKIDQRYTLISLKKATFAFKFSKIKCWLISCQDCTKQDFCNA